MDWFPSPGYADANLYRDMQRLSRSLQSLKLTSFTATVLGDASSAANLIGKYESRPVWDSTNQRVLYASGGGAADAWVNALGATTITPS